MSGQPEVKPGNLWKPTLFVGSPNGCLGPHPKKIGKLLTRSWPQCRLGSIGPKGAIRAWKTGRLKAPALKVKFVVKFGWSCLGRDPRFGFSRGPFPVEALHNLSDRWDTVIHIVLCISLECVSFEIVVHSLVQLQLEQRLSTWLVRLETPRL